MTLEEFYIQHRKDLAEFIAIYQEMDRLDPERFPLKRECMAEWLIEFCCFIDQTK